MSLVKSETSSRLWQPQHLLTYEDAQLEDWKGARIYLNRSVVLGTSFMPLRTNTRVYPDTIIRAPPCMKDHFDSQGLLLAHRGGAERFSQRPDLPCRIAAIDGGGHYWIMEV